MSRHSGPLALAAVWSPSTVSIYDPVTQQVVTGESLKDVASRIGTSGREIVVGISQRNTFIRTLPAPNVPRVELAKIIAVRLGPLLPVGGHEYVSGFRVAGTQRTAIVGAVRADLLKAVHSEATEAGLNVRAILPRAFASWLLSKERSMPDCVVAASAGSHLTLDVIEHGELSYSRAVPLPETQEEFQSELEMTFRVANTGTLPVLATGDLNFGADATDPRPLIHAFTDPGAIDRLLFSLEPLETTIAREARKRKLVAGRAVVAAAIAVVLACYAALSTHAKLVADADLASDHMVKVADAKAKADKAVRSRNEMHDSYTLVDRAFNPSQTFADVIRVLGENGLPGAWFTGLTIERGKPLLIRGDATDLPSVTQYVANLSKNSRFRGVKLVFTHKAMIAKRTVVQFAVSGRIVGNLPLDSLPAEPDESDSVAAQNPSTKAGDRS